MMYPMSTEMNLTKEATLNDSMKHKKLKSFKQTSH